MPRAAASRPAWGDVLINGVAPDMDLHSDDAVYAAGLLTSWPARIGAAVFSPTATVEPRQGGIVMNGHNTVLFPTSGARAEYLAAIRTAQSSYFIDAVFEPDNDVGAGDREYPLYDQNNSGAAADHVVFAHQANDSLGFITRGDFAGSTWAVATLVRPSRRRGLRSVIKHANGDASIFEDGVLWQRITRAATPSIPLGFLYLGASYGVLPLAQFFKGSLGRMRIWWGIEPTEMQVAAISQPVLDEFGVPAPGAWSPLSPRPISCTGWWTSAGKTAASGVWTGGATLDGWQDRSGFGAGNRNLAASGAARPADAARVDGRAMVDFDPASPKFMTSGLAASSYLSLSSWEILIPCIVDAITTNEANMENNNSIFSEAAGNWGIHLSNNAGDVRVHAYQWDGARQFATSLAGQLVLGSPTLIHAWFGGGTISLRVGSNAPVTDASGNITALAGAFGLGRRGAVATTVFDGKIGEPFVFNAVLSAADRASARAFVQAMYPSMAAGA